MNKRIVILLEELKQVNGNGSLPFDAVCTGLDNVKRQAGMMGFDEEWLTMVFERGNIHDWVRMALKLDHLVNLFKGRVICVDNFKKESV